ncbi:MAG: type I-U CRISPR-associated protein Cas7 [Acidobacteria bacterium]|nr:type I-U CRISPR-associated protein Cas7 [Acidobacteriota bacterium]
MGDALTQFDNWLDIGGPAALVLREPLIPVEGRDGILFPATFAASEDRTFRGGYNIDRFDDGTSICLIDSVGSQANRLEPLFATPPYSSLIPQLVITAGEKRISILEAGHRAGDALVRSSSLQEELRSAFKAAQQNDALPLARIAPTSLVFGAWDSRDTQAKLPRLIASTIRAFNVKALTRSAQYVPATDYVKGGMLEEPADEKTRKLHAERGFAHVPSTAVPGGIIAESIRRDATLHLGALRLLAADPADQTMVLRRYVLGLSLVALTASATGYLRQGCNLVPDPDQPSTLTLVGSDGARQAANLTHSAALAFAREAASAFGLDVDRAISFGTAPDRQVPFDKALAARDLAGDESGERKSKKSKKAN